MTAEKRKIFFPFLRQLHSSGCTFGQLQVSGLHLGQVGGAQGRG